MKKLLIIFSFLCSAYFVQAQSFEAGGWLGVSYYFGDLNTNFSLKHPGPAGGVFGRYNFNDRLAIKLGANYAKIGFYDSYSKYAFQQARNLSFESHLIDGSFQFEFNFLKFIHGHEDHFFSPYLFGGLSIFYYKPRAKYQGEWVSLQPLGTEGQGKNNEYFLLQPALNYGLGFKFDLNFYWSLNLELSARSLFTDYLDDISTSYPDKQTLENDRGQLAVLLSDRSWEVSEAPIGEFERQRGDSQSKDSYAVIGLSLVYNFASVKCPPWK